MTTDSQRKSLATWHKALLRLILPFIWIFCILATSFTVVFLGIPCAITAFMSWVIFGDIHSEYTIIWCVFPLGFAIYYTDWLKEKDVIKP